MYCSYYIGILRENGIDISELDEFRYMKPWSGCEKEIKPEKYNNDNLILNEEQIMNVLSELYLEAYKKVTAPKPVFELMFDKVTTEKGERKLCRARLDEEHLEQCRKDGFHIMQIDIDATKFWNPLREEIENDRKIYYLEFYLDEG